MAKTNNLEDVCLISGGFLGIANGLYALSSEKEVNAYLLVGALIPLGIAMVSSMYRDYKENRNKGNRNKIKLSR